MAQHGPNIGHVVRAPFGVVAQTARQSRGIRLLAAVAKALTELAQPCIGTVGTEIVYVAVHRAAQARECAYVMARVAGSAAGCQPFGGIPGSLAEEIVALMGKARAAPATLAGGLGEGKCRGDSVDPSQLLRAELWVAEVAGDPLSCGDRRDLLAH